MDRRPDDPADMYVLRARGDQLSLYRFQRPGQRMRLIVLPQSMRVIIPPTGNETISMLKNTSLVIVLGSVFDLLFEAQQIYAATYQTIPLLIVASIWYLALTSVLYVGQYFIERRYGRGFSRAEQMTLRARGLGFRGGEAAP